MSYSKSGHFGHRVLLGSPGLEWSKGRVTLTMDDKCWGTSLCFDWSPFIDQPGTLSTISPDCTIQKFEHRESSRLRRAKNFQPLYAVVAYPGRSMGVKFTPNLALDLFMFVVVIPADPSSHRSDNLVEKCPTLRELAVKVSGLPDPPSCEAWPIAGGENHGGQRLMDVDGYVDGYDGYIDGLNYGYNDGYNYGYNDGYNCL